MNPRVQYASPESSGVLHANASRFCLWILAATSRIESNENHNQSQYYRSAYGCTEKLVAP
jgi:predicted transcriptional regulator